MRHLALTALACGSLFGPAAPAFAQSAAPAPDPSAAPPPPTATPKENTAAPADEVGPPEGSAAPATETAAAPEGSTDGPATNHTPLAEPQRPTPPRLLQSVEPAYPESQRESGRAASVGLVLTLDATGAVTDAAVVASGGADFDAAALRAARELSFEPARLGERAVPAKIPFRFEFQVAPPPPPQPAALPGPAAASAVATAAPAAAEASLEVDVEGERPPREPTRQVMTAAEIIKLPGTNGDALRAIQNLPGFGRPPGLDGILIVRGSSPRDSQVFVDGTNVPIVYHFGGLSSVVPSEFLDRIDFYPGNFGPQYGRASGGIIDVGTRSPHPDRVGGLLQFDLIDGRLLVEGPLGDDTRFMLAGRRSWVDVWLGPALDSAGVEVSTAPVYYDYQALIEHDVSRDTTLRLFAFGSDDRLELLLSSPDASDPAAGGDLLLHTAFWRVQARADTRLSDQTRWRTTLALGTDNQQFALGSIATDVDLYVLDLRSDVRAQLSPAFTLMGGVDIQVGRYDVRWNAPPFDLDSGDGSGPLFGRPPAELLAEGTFLRPSGYAQAELTPLRGLKLLPGVRADYARDTESWTLDPRLGVRYDLYPGELRTTLKGGIGVFHQPPEPYETIRPFGTPGVQSERALHYSLGIEQELSRPLEVSLEGFYKDLSDIVISTPAAGTSESGLEYRNLGSGRSYGGELLLRYKPEGRFFGWVAYTLSRSERQDGPGQPEELFEYDQTHVLTALGSLKLGRGWQLGARFRYVTGSPYTPYLGGILDYDAGAYAPLESQPEYSSRLPAFHQLDVRVDKTWDFESWKLSAYLDVQNAYNRKNTESLSYNYDYSQSKPLPGLPILPVLGIRGEL